ncbi:hypothetical protein BH11MYX4_BH11MYX4_64920 [soil metagenome]
MRPRLVPLAITLGAALTASGCSSCKRAPDPGGGTTDGSAATSGAGVS